MTWLTDTAERVGRTFLAAWLGWWAALSGHDFADLYSHQALLTGFTAAAATLLLCLGAAKVNTAAGQPASASFTKP